jgi:photosystem II stability/assembly factor-like uncharacterized protein
MTDAKSRAQQSRTAVRRARILPLILLILAVAIPASAQWQMMGPFGGNARALAYDPFQPDHILLGSGAGALFDSIDNGRHWRPFAHLGSGYDLMLENIAFDPEHRGTIYVGAWSITGAGGGLFVSHNGGRSWSEAQALAGKSIQAIALAASDPHVLVVGSLDGLYRSHNAGKSWERITPAGDPNLKNFESLAIDPHNPQIIYAGTWHLPWKTTDGGRHWSRIHEGMITDSDVFSIILDHSNPQTMYASACSGIYRSDNGGELFQKVRGIPSSARRTRILKQDPADANVVYAGTTEGLWKTTDGGAHFKRISPANFILNSVLVDPRNPRRLLIATDRGGVFASDNAGASFYPSNDGFSQRQVTAVLADPARPSDLYVSVINDKEFGGVLYRHNGQWSQLDAGLNGADVFDLERAPGGELLAATNHGLFVLNAGSQRWVPSRTVLSGSQPEVRKVALRGRRGRARARARASRSLFTGRATSLAFGNRHWFAATADGLLVSGNRGSSWTRAELEGARRLDAVAANGSMAAAADLRQLWTSRDEGAHWTSLPLPSGVTRINSVAITSGDQLWVATREGVLHWRGSLRAGQWELVQSGLPQGNVLSVQQSDGWLLATTPDAVYISRNRGESWQRQPSASLEMKSAQRIDGQLYLVSRQHGLLEAAAEKPSRNSSVETAAYTAPVR